MTLQFKRFLAYTLSFVIAGGLLFLALRGVDIDELREALATASYIWVIPLFVITMISHLLRAWRWQILLDALPDQQRSGELKKVSLRTAFLSVMIGYLINFLVPRLGEIVRAGNLSRQEGLRFSGVLGTVVVERVIDVAFLALGMLSLGFLFSDQLVFFQERIMDPTVDLATTISPVWMLVGLVGLTMGGYFAFRSINLAHSPRFLRVRRKATSIINAFKDGMLTITRAQHRIALIASTVLMWICYTFMAYLPLVMLGMHTSYNLDMTAGWSLMVFGAMGMAVPSQGGIGSFHIVTKLALVNLYMVDEGPAFTYAILTHGLPMILYIIVGVLAFFVQGLSLRSLTSPTADLNES